MRADANEVAAIVLPDQTHLSAPISKPGGIPPVVNVAAGDDACGGPRYLKAAIDGDNHVIALSPSLAPVIEGIVIARSHRTGPLAGASYSVGGDHAVDDAVGVGHGHPGDVQIVGIPVRHRDGDLLVINAGADAGPLRGRSCAGQQCQQGNECFSPILVVQSFLR